MLSLRAEAVIRRSFALGRVTRGWQLQSSSSRVLNEISTRHYRSQPTHGIGRYRHLLPPEKDPKKKEKLPTKDAKPTSEYEYGLVNIQVSGYDMTSVEHYSQYIHNLCNRLSVKVEECYANPTRTKEVMLLQEHTNKMLLDSVLTTHERVIQVRGVSSIMVPILIEVLMMNQPEGVQLLLKEHTEADYQARFKARPDLENLMASMS
ncbi:39S ribosomal protein L48, mitochondrial [Spea bombifrons]|uniref:39S ribosomal protein L48, mitochondrial n=1 Tax=Spea bombifrons TaxID=233779 RepID=UPI00234BB6CB|nr:39S ribosomal protein L48, mitochondrial [Spea bombifrons]